MRVLALDIGGTKIAAALVTGNQLTQRTQLATPQHDVASTMEQTLAQLLSDYAGSFDCIAVASTGIINQGILTALNPKNLGGLAAFPLANTFAKYSDKPCFLLNDAQAATFAEYQLQPAEQCQNFAFITVSTGVGGGLILDHQLLTEPHGIAGHIGHTLADPQGPMCGCGRVGCVEAIASGRAIEAIASTWSPPCTPKEVFALFHQGNVAAQELISRSAKAIANLAADLVIGMDIQKIVIGGSVGLAEGYLPLVRHFLQQLPTIYQCPLENARLGQDAGLIGAAAWAESRLN